MLLERIYDEDLAQASYLIGCQKSNEAIVVDPRRDISIYLDLALNNDMAIVGVTETHIHADYLSGTLELADATGAQMYVSGEGGPDWSYAGAFEGAIHLKDGDLIELGNITLQAVHTPGHTPEHMSFLVTDGAQADAPGYLLTGDFVFVGDVGRPDLLDEAAGGVDTRWEGAKDLFRSLEEKFLPLPDYVQVLPGHGSGSACGKSLGAVPTTTVGYERTFSWWAPYLNAGDQAGFVARLLSDQPDAPSYFGRMKRQNRLGPEILGHREELREYSPVEVTGLLSDNSAVLVDTRHHEKVKTGSVPGALNIPGPAQAATYGAWAYDPDSEDTPLILLAEGAADAKDSADHLLRVGIDGIMGYVTTLTGFDLEVPQRVSAGKISDYAHGILLDVRNSSEHRQGHIPGADHFSGGKLLAEIDRLPKEKKILVYCQTGVRSSVAAQALRRAGFDVAEIEGSYEAWVDAGGEVQRA